MTEQTPPTPTQQPPRKRNLLGMLHDIIPATHVNEEEIGCFGCLGCFANLILLPLKLIGWVIGLIAGLGDQ